MQHLTEKEIIENFKKELKIGKYCYRSEDEDPIETDRITTFWLSLRSQELQGLKEEIGKLEPAPNLDVYLDKVKNGNKDDMYDYGVKLERECVLALLENRLEK